MSDSIIAPQFEFSPSINQSTMEIERDGGYDDGRNVVPRIDDVNQIVPYSNFTNIPPNLVAVSVEELMMEKPLRKRTIIYLQLIHIVSGSTNGQGNTSTYQSYIRNKKKNESTNYQYYRLFLFRDISSSSGQVVYMVEGKAMNDKLWSKNPEIRETGVVTIGTYIDILSPLPITAMFFNDTPILESYGGCIVLKILSVVKAVTIDHGIKKNTTRSFVMNSILIEVLDTSVHETNCAGSFCDRQHAIEVCRSSRACGCFAMQSMVSNIVLMHSIECTKNGDKILYMDQFSSLQFSKLYLKHYFSATVNHNHLDNTEEYYALETCIDQVVEFVNRNGGFTIVGWYKRGEINDMSTEDSENHVDSGVIGYHAVSIYPTASLCRNPENLSHLKFEYIHAGN